MEDQIEIDVPCHFLCPISLQLMVDPVTVSTGITFDRHSIETWLHSCNKSTCPVTKQPLSVPTDLTPNHTLHRLITSWSLLHAPQHVTTTTKLSPHVTSQNDVVELLNDAPRATCLRRLRSIALESDRNRSLLEGSGAFEFLVAVVKNDAVEEHERDEALTILHHVKPGHEQIKRLTRNDDVFTYSLARFLSRGTHQKSRAYATLLLKSVYDVAEPVRLVTAGPEIFAGLVRVLRDRSCHVATKASLKLLIELCPWGRNRVKAVENGAVWVLVELLLDTCERRACELSLTVLDLLCACAEGRAELVRHAAGLAVVAKKALRVSHVATDRAVRVVSHVARRSGTVGVLQEMVAVGVVAKLCLVLQVDSSVRAKELAREVLRMHARAWRGSGCIPPHLLSSYPSSMIT